MKILGNVVAFTFLGCEKVFEFLSRGRSAALTRVGAHSVGRPPAPLADPPADKVVESHHVLSGRLMDAPTGRLYPSSRHRVPPWVPPPGL